MKQTKLFAVKITQDTKDKLRAEAKKTGIHYGIMFATNGRAMIERINPTAHYNYIWRTDKADDLMAC